MGVTADLAPGGGEDDGLFWMPFQAFIEIFGGDVNISPVTLPCPRNSQVIADASSKKPRCRRCRQPHSRTWVLLDDGSWCRLVGQEHCFLCLRATCRAHEPSMRVLGVHTQPALCLAPPPTPRRLEVCKYGARCYRRNPQHFHDNFHPCLLPPAPPCMAGCGRSCASGFPTCCKSCVWSPPSLQVTVPAKTGLERMSGLYKPVSGKSSNGKPVWSRDGSCWLWLGAVWMFSQQEKAVGGNAGCIAQEGHSAGFPHLVKGWTYVKDDAWVSSGITVEVVSTGSDPSSPAVRHQDFCNKRFEREEDLAQEADKFLAAVRT